MLSVAEERKFIEMGRRLARLVAWSAIVSTSDILIVRSVTMVDPQDRFLECDDFFRYQRNLQPWL